jgi:hypothetical protein
MNIIIGAILIGTAAALYLKQHPPLRSTATKVYAVSIGFGVFSVVFPMISLWMAIVGAVLQVIAIGCCIIAAHDFRAYKAIRRHKSECKHMGKEMQLDFEIDKQMCNAFFKKGVEHGKGKA